MTDIYQRRAHERAVLNIIEKNKNAALDVLLEQVALALKEQFTHYTGVYFYLLKGEMLELGTYCGRPTEHSRIPIGAGICGRAARVKKTVLVDDVYSDTEYIACSLDTRSEIVVPIMRGDLVFGEIDIDSDIPAAFSEQDRMFLDQVAQLVATRFMMPNRTSVP